MMKSSVSADLRKKNSLQRKISLLRGGSNQAARNEEDYFMSIGAARRGKVVSALYAHGQPTEGDKSFASSPTGNTTMYRTANNKKKAFLQGHDMLSHPDNQLSSFFRGYARPDPNLAPALQGSFQSNTLSFNSKKVGI